MRPAAARCETFLRDPQRMRSWAKPRVVDAATGRVARDDAARDTMPYGTHHTKAFILGYSNGVRVAISTANVLRHNWCATL